MKFIKRAMFKIGHKGKCFDKLVDVIEALLNLSTAIGHTRDILVERMDDDDKDPITVAKIDRYIYAQSHILSLVDMGLIGLDTKDINTVFECFKKIEKAMGQSHKISAIGQTLFELRNNISIEISEVYSTLGNLYEELEKYIDIPDDYDVLD